MLTESTRDVFYSRGLKLLSEAAVMGRNRWLNPGGPTGVEGVGLGQDRLFAKAWDAHSLRLSLCYASSVKKEAG